MRDVFRFGRADRSFLARWFWEVDRPLLVMILVLMGVGIIAVAAASPAAAFRLSDSSTRLPPLYFLQRQMIWAGLGLVVLLGVSMLPAMLARRLALVGFPAALVLLAAVPFVGAEVNGATRWIQLPVLQLQPIELVKPLFVVATAWLLAARFDDRSLPVMSLSFAMLAVIVLLLAVQPDFGQAALVSAVWLAQAALAGMPVALLGGVAVLGAGGMVLAYLSSAHVARRIDGFLHGEGDTYQVDRALDAFRSGGLFGTGPGDGTAKFRLPEAQTDYVFAVIGEEFGAIACFALALLYVGIILRVLLQLVEDEDPFTLLAGAGLVAQFGGQAFINMSVNLALAPSKGMTLPLVSHGGSSYLATALGLGLLLAITRRNRHVQHSPYLRQVPR
ncbi:MAG: putative peptidoglycan glycosyltransferase FtsW [Sphingomonadaceae bacterium]